MASPLNPAFLARVRADAASEPVVIQGRYLPGSRRAIQFLPLGAPVPTGRNGLTETISMRQGTNSLREDSQPVSTIMSTYHQAEGRVIWSVINSQWRTTDCM